jgi:hypothetical protein
MWKVKAQLKRNEVIIPECRHPGEGRGPVFANAKTRVADIYVFHRFAMKNPLRGKPSLSRCLGTALQRCDDSLEF